MPSAQCPNCGRGLGVDGCGSCGYVEPDPPPAPPAKPKRKGPHRQPRGGLITHLPKDLEPEQLELNRRRLAEARRLLDGNSRPYEELEELRPTRDVSVGDRL